MNKAQWKAIYDYCEEYCITRAELLKELKANGTVERTTSLENLGEYVNKPTYNAMIEFLEANL